VSDTFVTFCQKDIIFTPAIFQHPPATVKGVFLMQELIIEGRDSDLGFDLFLVRGNPICISVLTATDCPA